MTFGSLFHLQMVMAYFHTFSSNKGVYLWCIDFKYFISFLGKQGFYFSRFRIVASIQNSAIFFFYIFCGHKKLFVNRTTYLGWLYIFWSTSSFPRSFVVEQILRAAEMLVLSITSSSPPYIACSALKKKRGHRHRSQFRSLWRPGC